MSNLVAPVLLAIEPQPSDLVVTLTGISLVFAILIVLMLIIMLEGKFFDSMNARKKAEKEAQMQKASAPAAPSQPVAAAPAAQEEPEVEPGIPGEVIAAIAAAVAALSGGKYTLRSVRRAGHGRSAWGKAGVSDVTSPF